MVEITTIEATTISDAWFQCISKILDVGFKYEIQHGSYVGQTRLEFDHITIYIKHPYAEPYDLMLPQIPTHLNIPNPVENGYVEQYMPYLMTSHIEPMESYTYGSRLTKFFIGYDEADGPSYGSQVEYWTSVLKKTNSTNQAVLQVAQPDDCLLDDPPCLRHIDMRIKDDQLIFYPYFRCIDSNKELLYRVDTKICYGRMADVHNLVKTGMDVYVISNNEGKAEWGKVLESHIRKCDVGEIKKYSIKAEEFTNITDDHWLFDDSLSTKQAKNFKVGDKQIKLISTACLKRDVKAHLDLFDLLSDNTKYYIRNLKLAEIKNLCVAPKPSWKDKKVLPIAVIDNIDDIPKASLIGVARSKISRKRYMLLCKDLGYFFGAWLANGWFKDSKCSLISIGNYRKDKIDKLHFALRNAKIEYTTYLQDSVTIFHIGDKMLYDIMIELEFESGALFKNVPSFMFNAPIDFIKGTFEGWIDGDSGCTCSKDLAYGFRLLGSLVGIKTSLYEEAPRKVYFAMDDRYIYSNKLYRVFEVEGVRNKIIKDIYYKKLESITEVDVDVESVIDFKIDKYENFCIGSGNIIVHNSWDLWGGFPANLAGIAVLQKYMADRIGVWSGPIIASSKGLHIYGYVEELAKLRVGK